jgi:hypothetical protein
MYGECSGERHLFCFDYVNSWFKLKRRSKNTNISSKLQTSNSDFVDWLGEHNQDNRAPPIVL